ncbi:MAG: hypothetical protein IPL87_03325 [Candidatus Moraniibacteriota bacterium]|nr:MAG: hypothetical protein IPL87_03325 [Candidatus Moranbacteria bacterium]
MTTLFFFLSGIYGLFLNFQFFSEPFLMLSSAGSVFLVGRNIFLQYFRNAPEKARFFAFFLALFSGEMAWVSSFWPFGYLTVGAVSLLFLSVLWDTLLLSLQRTITLRRLLVQLSVLVLFLGLVLSSSIWRPVV